ncbi:DUF2066 domain-containing protein [Vibrio sp. JPW-9-11-11]|uniref:DUF2066 domain-containing protein n=1 Tax=Vibrio sp. JPW-9-11-11 TaxID=1416532 RepID=UPI0015943640|nr:DUF2066 domain-containing protein [Vibrio sp. JPW-9-11-11]NVD07181.1 DUF2066 domain-containing protein [Vibrio sp. JPW-9-11-11]
MRHIALFVLGLFALPVLALTNVDLYRSEVVIDQSTDNADSRARVEGMKEVIIRASGDVNAPENPVVTKALRQSAQYLAQLSYGQSDGQQTLKMVFSAPHIRSLLSQAQLPIWPAARANLLVWLVEEQSERNIIWEHSPSVVLDKMKLKAAQRGLPLTVPVGDFDDITGVAVSDLWGGFIQPVGQASQRYPVDAVLVVKAQANSVRWTLYDQKPNTIGVTRQAPLAGSNNGGDAASKMIEQISDYYAKKSAVLVASESSQAIKVRFTELNDAVSFFTLENQLKSLSSVASLEILKIQGNQVTFNVHLLTSEQEFEQEIRSIKEVQQLESVNETPSVTLPEPTTIPAGNPDDGLQVESTVAVEMQPIADVIATEMVLVFEWQGQPYVAPQPKAQTPATEDENAIQSVLTQ